MIKKNVSVFCIGDSLVYGYGVKQSQCWTRLLSEMTGMNVENRGINGDTTSGMLSRLHSSILPEMRNTNRPCCAVIMGGYNDIFLTGSDLSPRENISSMVMTLNAEGIRPIVCIPAGLGKNGFPYEWEKLFDFRKSAEITERYAEWLIKYCKTFAVEYIDLRQTFAGFGETMLLDGIHPNPHGHLLIAKSINEVLSDIYGY